MTMTPTYKELLICLNACGGMCYTFGTSFIVEPHLRIVPSRRLTTIVNHHTGTKALYQ